MIFVPGVGESPQIALGGSACRLRGPSITQLPGLSRAKLLEPRSLTITTIIIISSDVEGVGRCGGRIFEGFVDSPGYCLRIQGHAPERIIAISVLPRGVGVRLIGPAAPPLLRSSYMRRRGSAQATVQVPKYRESSWVRVRSRSHSLQISAPGFSEIWLWRLDSKVRGERIRRVYSPISTGLWMRPWSERCRGWSYMSN